MESSDSASSKLSKGFFSYVFNFDEDSKGEMANIIQYSVLCIIPLVVLNKTIQKFVPEADETKGSLEITAEVLIQVIVMFIGVFFINRIVAFVPTYSGASYPDFSVIYIVLGVLMITLSLQTKLGEKVSILVDRVVELWEGKPASKKGAKKGAVRVSQPISGQVQQQSQPVYTDGTAISQLPTAGPTQGTPDYNAMYRNDSTPLVNAALPSSQLDSNFQNMSMGGPMAANEMASNVFGGSPW